MATSGSKGFWRKNSSAIPGRINLQRISSSSDADETIPSKSSSSSSGTAATNCVNVANSSTTSTANSHSSGEIMPQPHNKASTSFKDFEKSVSDAWDIGDLENASVTRPAEMVEIAISHQPPNKIRTDLDPTLASTNSKPSITFNSSSKSSSVVAQLPPSNNSKHAKIEALIRSAASIEIEDLRKLSWPGLTHKARAKAWKILCGYLPGNTARQAEIMQRKQEEYQRYVDLYFPTRDQADRQDTYRQIHIDIPRMSPVVGLFQQRCVQEIFERILFIRAIRHPASSYVQGMNDLVTPFFLVFLRDGLQTLGKMNANDDHGSNFVPADLEVESLPLELRQSVEADSFWCLNVVLDMIQDNYTFSQPGIQVKVKQLEDLVQRVDSELHNHLTSHDVSYLQFSFRWMNNLLMRELPVKASIRLWDTYLSQVNGHSHFHLYVCAAFLIHWKSELMKKTDFHTLLMFLQNLPTRNFAEKEIDLLVAEAYRLSYLFADAPSHLQGCRSNHSASAAAASI